ncbi:MAG TPA: neutral zinc metallopeptidase [Bryobacteraceae bacterium]|nr:neutral zinc metallopeptidase [Bryobacteraceae bacterium]
MEWTPGGTSGDIEDRRNDSGGGGFGGGGFGGFHLGILGTIIVGLLSLVFHQNLFRFFMATPEQQVTRRQPDTARDQREQPEVGFVSFVLDDVQHTWDTQLPAQEHRPYRHAKLVLFRDAYPSGCGTAETAIGPFYCPEDEKVYLDLGFFDELRTKFGAPGEFAQAYVIAHEIGHHVQKILGIEQKVRRLQQRDPSEQNPLSVRLELQADCLAGVWGYTTEQRGLVHEQDVNAALRAAAAVGDDRLQRAGQGYVNPETFTHGTSAQRVQWFRRGLDSGRIASCSTFQ